MNIQSNANDLIIFKNLSKSYENSNFTINILNDINFIFEQKNSYALMGNSGSGKSTVIHLLANLETVSIGKILYNGKDLQNISKDDKQKILLSSIGIVFQFPYLLNELTVIENVMLKGLVSKNTKANNLEIKEWALELLDSVNLVSKAYDSPANLSGGQQQRVALLRALFLKPNFLIADEPTAHLDSENRQIIIDLLLKWHKQYNTGLIIATHDPVLSNLMQYKIEIADNKFKLA